MTAHEAADEATQPFAIQCVSSFELLALWLATGYGIGMTAQLRITQARV